ncbi:MAG: hypothetical protein ACYC6N_07085 [Pirellulaceae bacterium]
MSTSTSDYSRSELAIVVILRVVGIAALLAIPAIFFPYSWMNAIHERLGLATLPDTPIVSYLARSLSLFYAVMGTITLFITSDIRRYRSLVTLVGLLYIVLGLTQLGIDVYSGMPILWTLAEGPFGVAIGAMVLWLQHAARS